MSRRRQGPPQPRTLSRRTMLRGLSAGLSLPLLPSLAGRAHADPGFPTRVVFVTQGQGTLPEHLVVPGTGPSDFSLGPVLAPLAPFKDRLAICRGIDDQTNILDGTYNGHTRCLLHTWTSRGMVWSGNSDGGSSPTGAGGASLDQHIAASWGGETPYESLQFGVGASSQTVLSHFWKGIGQPLIPENSPAAMYERLFEDLNGTDPALLATRRYRRQSVLSAVASQFELLRPRVSSEDRQKLDIHLASLEAVEQSLVVGGLGDSCAPPVLDFSDSGTPATAHQQIDMLAMSMGCDLTRVSSLTLGDFQSWPWLDVSFGTGWHDAVHAGPASPGLDDLISTFRWYNEQLAYLLASLDAIPEGDGTLLDHTLVVVGNIFSEGWEHSSRGKTYLLAGGAGGLIGGRHHTFDGAHNGDLFATILQALGFEDETFGDPAFAGGPLAGVFA